MASRHIPISHHSTAFLSCCVLVIKLPVPYAIPFLYRTQRWLTRARHRNNGKSIIRRFTNVIASRLFASISSKCNVFTVQCEFCPIPSTGKRLHKFYSANIVTLDATHFSLLSETCRSFHEITTLHLRYSKGGCYTCYICYNPGARVGA